MQIVFNEDYEEPEKYHKCSHNGFFYPESEMTLLVLCKNVSSWVANENLNQYKNENRKQFQRSKRTNPSHS